jgi:hypothetical protein
MYGKLLFAIVLTACIAHAQYGVPQFNFNIGGGIGFPLSSTSDFANEGADFVIAAGPNFSRVLGINAEFMWHELPVKRGVIDQTRCTRC